jgi:hypothetical protein
MSRNKQQPTVMSVVITLLLFFGTMAIRCVEDAGFVCQMLGLSVSVMMFVSVINLVIDIGIMLGHDVADV